MNNMNDIAEILKMAIVKFVCLPQLAYINIKIYAYGAYIFYLTKREKMLNKKLARLEPKN